MRWLVRVLASVAASVLAAAAMTVPGLADGELDVQVHSVDDSAFPAMTAVISVEGSGRPLESLDVSALTVTDNGSPVAVTRVARVQDARIPTTVVATLDTSGSMLGASLASAKTALGGLVQRLTPGDSVALVSFADRAQLVIAPTTDKSGVGIAVSALQASGNTALYGAVAESARVAASGGSTRRLVILLTDGEEYGNVSGLSREESLERAAQSGAVFYVIGLGVGADREYLAQLAARTGGRYLDAPTTADIDTGFAAIEELLRSQFVLSLESTSPAMPLSREVSVTVSRDGANGTTSFAFYSMRTAPTPVDRATATTPVPTADVKLPAETASDSSKDSGGPPLWPVLPLAVVAGAGIVWAGVWRARRAAPTDSLPAVSDLFASPPSPLVPTSQPASVAVFVRRGGPEGVSTPERLMLPPEPVSVGWSPACQVQLPKADGLAAVHARLWWRDGTVMLHDLGGGATTVNGAPARWASLSPGDGISFGPYRYQYAIEPADD